MARFPASYFIQKMKSFARSDPKKDRNLSKRQTILDHLQLARNVWTGPELASGLFL